MPQYSINDIVTATVKYQLGLEGDAQLVFNCYSVFIVDFIQQLDGVFYYYDRSRQYAYPESAVTVANT